MVDRDRVLAKLDELEGYLGELRAIAPDRFDAYQRTETKRACERLLQVSMKAVIDHLRPAGGGASAGAAG